MDSGRPTNGKKVKSSDNFYDTSEASSSMLPTPVVPSFPDDKVYEPSEDSYLLMDSLEADLEFLQGRFGTRVPLVSEIGTGSGIVVTFLQQLVLPKAICIASDVNLHACRTVLNTASANKATSRGGLSPRDAIDTCQMALTTGIRSRAIDVLLFNPPYVPAEEVPLIPASEEDHSWLDLALLGGEDGMVVTQVVLDSLHEILEPTKGVAYILFCARNKPDQIADQMRQQGWVVDTVLNRRAGWEVLTVLKFTSAKSTV